MNFADFLTSYQLYTKCSLDIPTDLDLRQFRWPAIKVYCEDCKSVQTFTGSLLGGPHPSEPLAYSIANKVAGFKYMCASCNKYYSYYLVKFLDLPVAIKIGQYPPLDIAIEKSLREQLGAHEDIYKKGLICESQGYGIGAYAYYRRIVEETIDRLLTSIHDLLDEKDKVTYEKALRDAQKGTVAKDKIELVKDLIPVTLRSNNMNPLAILHEELSAGIHDKTDEECLEAAVHIRELLVHLVEQINLAEQAKKKSSYFTDRMRKLLEKKSKTKI